MKEILELFNQAIQMFQNLMKDIETNKKKLNTQLYNDIIEKANIINSTPFLNLPKIENDKNFISTFIENNFNNSTEFEKIELNEIQEIKKLPCDSDNIINFSPLDSNKDSCCDEKEILDNTINFNFYQDPIIKEEGLLPDIDNPCIKKIEKWSNLIIEYNKELTSLKTWESDNYIFIQYWKLYLLYYEIRETILKKINIGDLINIVSSISITKRTLEKSLHVLSNEFNIKNSSDDIIILLDNKNKKKGTFYEWGEILNKEISKISDDEKEKTTKVLTLEKTIKKIYIEDNIIKYKNLLELWIYKKLPDNLINNSKESLLFKWKQEREILEKNESYLNIKNNLTRISFLEKEIEISISKMQDDLLKNNCSSRDNFKEENLPEENPNYRGNPNIESPNMFNITYWKKFCNFATLMNLIPIHWPIGLLIPSPSGVIKVPLPIIWKPIFITSIPSGIIVFLIGQCGICPSPVLFIWNTDSKRKFINVNADSMSFPLAIRPSNNWRKKCGSNILPIIPWISNLYSKYDPYPEFTKTIPYIQDDFPSWERLSLKNPFLLLFLNEWCKNGKKSCGFFENP